jgi:thermitase
MNQKYTVGGRTIELQEDPNLVAVRYREPAPLSTRATVAARSGAGPFENRYEIPKEKFTILPVAPVAEAASIRHSNAVQKLAAQGEVARVANVFKVGNKHVVATERILVGFSKDAGEPGALIRQHKGTVLSQKGTEYVVQLPEGTDPFAVADALGKSQGVAYAEPDLVTIGSHLARPSAPIQPAAPGNDPALGGKYGPKITRAIEAWAIQSGDPGIRIAILDEGVDTRHVDLRDHIVGSFDAEDNDPFQDPNPWDGHGTACAGLAAALPKSSQGMRGIGGGCSILAVRIAYSNGPRERWTTSASWIARAIDWSWENGADVLSNSWGGGAPSQAVINAFERARTQGRQGKGAVVIIAAGNDASPVDFPGNLPEMLTVSATNQYDEFKSPTSRDGEGWGSNFGPEVGISAPGVYNFTTDITGAGGYNNAGDYYTHFNGTSSATPMVAGAAALILSANPVLREQQVRTLLKNNADKVGSQPYVNGRNDQMGSGRLNVLAAVRAARNGSGPIAGTVVAATGPNGTLAAFYLNTPAGEHYLLRHYQGHEAMDIASLEHQSLAYFAPYANQPVTIHYGRRQDTPQGPILWGARI